MVAVAKGLTVTKCNDGSAIFKKEESTGQVVFYVHATAADVTAISGELAAGGVAPPTDDGFVPSNPGEPEE